MVVEPDAVWLGVANHGEYRTTGGGLLRFGRTTRKTERVEFREVVREMARLEDGLLLATDFGAAVLTKQTLRRFFVDQTADGRLKVSEAVLGN
jgi:hypothetical protein